MPGSFASSFSVWPEVEVWCVFLVSGFGMRFNHDSGVSAGVMVLSGRRTKTSRLSIVKKLGQLQGGAGATAARLPLTPARVVVDRCFEDLVVVSFIPEVLCTTVESL